MLTCWTRSERRSLLLGLMLFAAALLGLFPAGPGGRAVAEPDAEPAPRKRPRAEIQKVAGADLATADFEEKMEAAMDEAFEHLDDFLAVIAKPKSTQEQFSIKYIAIEGDEGEAVWVNDLKYADQKFTGKIASNPQYVKKIKFGQTVTVAEEDVVDWMYVEQEKLRGGYTIRVQRNAIAEEDREKFDAQFKFKFD